MPFISTVGVVFFPINAGFKIFKRLDQGWIEYFGIQQFFTYFIKISKINLLFQYNNLKIYFIILVF
jgi:NADH-ubiquinone oxidoreductase chain 5